MPVSETPPLPIQRASRSASGIITIQLIAPYAPPLHLGLIRIREVNTTTPIAGTIQPGGSDREGGIATLQVTPHLLGAPLAAVAAHTVVTLSYETATGTFQPVDIALG